MEENRIWKQTKNTDNIIKHTNRISGELLKEKTYNKQSISLYWTLITHYFTPCNTHVYIFYFIFYTFIYKGSYSNID